MANVVSVFGWVWKAEKNDEEGVMTAVVGGIKNKTLSWGHNANYVIGGGVKNVDSIATWNVQKLTIGSNLNFEIKLWPDFKTLQNFLENIKRKNKLATVLHASSLSKDV